MKWSEYLWVIYYLNMAYMEMAENEENISFVFIEWSGNMMNSVIWSLL